MLYAAVSDAMPTAALFWRDSPDWSQSETPTAGKYLVLHHGSPVYAGRLPRPAAGAVAVNAIAAIADISYDCSRLETTVWVIKPNGKPARRVRLKSLASGLALSPHGKYLLVSLNNGNEGDGFAKLILFNVPDGRELWRLNTYAVAAYADLSPRHDMITLYKPCPVNRYLRRRLRFSTREWIDRDFEFTEQPAIAAVKRPHH